MSFLRHPCPQLGIRSFAGRLGLTALLAASAVAHADTVVSDGRFTNVYVYPNPGQMSWEQHLAQLPPARKPADWARFTRQAIDQFTQTLMSPAWPSYFGALHQYGGINPPRFFGSYVASQACVDAALKDLHNGVMEGTTVRSLANCHVDGKDPSPQVNLIFSPDIALGDPSLTANGPDFCTQTGGHTLAYHAKGLNTPDFAVIPTAPGCSPSFDRLTESISHEDVEMLSDPGGFGHGGAGGTELGDKRCQSIDTPWQGFNVQRYRSDNDDTCWPLALPAGSSSATWVLAEGTPLVRFTGDRHEASFDVPDQRRVTAAPATQVQIWIQTGDDDLRGGSGAGDNVDVTLVFAGGSTLTRNVNAGRGWGNGQTHMALLNLPPGGMPVQDIRSVTLATHFGGGLGGDNWNVDRVALVVGFPSGSATSDTVPALVHTWLDASGGPLFRFTGDRHDLAQDVQVQDPDKRVTALDLIVSTGNDNLRGGDQAGDNCDITIELTHGDPITVPNANGSGTWEGWTDHRVSIPLPAGGLPGGEVKAVRLHTGFGGGIGGDNWNVQRLQLLATLVDEVRPHSAARYAAIWSRPAGAPMHARHGMTSAQYQAEFEQQARLGFRLMAINGYESDGQALYAAIWRQAAGPALAARHGMNAAEYQATFDQYTRQGYRLNWVHPYAVNGQVLFAAIWEQQAGPPWAARHGMRSAEYQAAFDAYAHQGYRLMMVNGYADGNEARYAAIWRKEAAPPAVARHGMSSSQYQAAFDSLGAQGYHLVHVSGFRVGPSTQFAALWEKSPGWDGVARHDMSASQFQETFDALAHQGYGLREVDGY